MPGFYQQSALIACIVNLSLAVFVLLRNPKSNLNRSFALLSAFLAMWNAGAFLQYSWLILLSLVTTPVAALHFTLIYLRHPGRFMRHLVRVSYGISTLFAWLILLQMVEQRFLYYLIALYITPLITIIIVLLYDRRKANPSRSQRQMTGYILFGSVAAILGGVSEFFSTLGTPAPRLGNIGVLLYAVIIAVAIVRHGLLDLHIVVGRGIILLTITFLFWSLLVVFGAWWSEAQYQSFFTILVATFLVLVLYEPLKRLVERQTDRVLQRQSSELQRILTRISRDASTSFDLRELFTRIGRSFEQAEKIGNYSMYLTDHQGRNLILARGTGESPRHLQNETVIEYFRQQKGVVERQELRRELEMWPSEERRDILNQVLVAMQNLRSDLSTPLIHRDRVIGLLNLGLRDSDAEFSRREKALIEAVCNQIAASVENSHIVDRLRKNDRLIALGEMASGLAHEIRNPLGAIKAAAQFLSSGAGRREIKEFMPIIIEEVDRLNLVLTRFLNYARPIEVPATRIQINDIIHRSARLLTTEHHDRPVNVQLALEEPSPELLGNADEIEQALLNLLLNAFHAMDGQGTVKVSSRSISGRRGKSDEGFDPSGEAWVETSIADDGPGIPEEEVDKIFQPFYTTRSKGCGLGLAIVQKIMQHHGGRIEVHSETGIGSQFVLYFPAAPNVDGAELNSEEEGTE